MEEGTSSQLHEYFGVLRLHKKLVLGLTAILVASALFYSFKQRPVYKSVAVVLVRPISLSPADVSGAGFISIDTERQVATSSAVAILAAERLGAVHARMGGITVRSTTNTNTLDFVATSTKARDAQATAEAFGSAYLDFRREGVLADLETAARPINARISEVNQQIDQAQASLFTSKDNIERIALQTQISSLSSERTILQQKLDDLILPPNLHVGDVLQPAPFPSSPATPDHVKTGLFALVVGLALGVGAAFFRDRLDDRLRGREDFEAYVGIPVLAALPPVRPSRRRKRREVLTLSQPRSQIAEAYRSLRVNLLFAAAQRGVKDLMVTSSINHEGKTTTTANLGVALALAGKRVIMVSADLRRPMLHEYFSVPNLIGLTNVLSGETSPLDGLTPVGIQNLSLLTSGPLPESPAEILGSDRMNWVLEQLRQMTDLVLIDSVPLLGVADAVALASLCGGVLFVTDLARTQRTEVAEARRQLERLKAPMIGAVLTNYDPSKIAPYVYMKASAHIEPDVDPRAIDSRPLRRWPGAVAIPSDGPSSPNRDESERASPPLRSRDRKHRRPTSDPEGD